MEAILLAAGLGKRSGLDIPKQFYVMRGKPFFIYSLEVFESIKRIDKVFVTCHQAFIDEYARGLKNYGIKKAELIEGGETRQQSVYKALKNIVSHRVLVHEAARPLISKEFVEEILDYEGEAIVPTIPISFTVSQGREFMEKELDRSQLHNIQLPQVFDRSVLLSAHEKAMKENFVATEDGILVYRNGGKVRFVKGRESNIKITTQIDLLVVDALFQGKQ